MKRERVAELGVIRDCPPPCSRICLIRGVERRLYGGSWNSRERVTHPRHSVADRAGGGPSDGRAHATGLAGLAFEGVND